MIVLDASDAVDLVLRVEPQATVIRGRLRQPGESIHAPHVVDGEVVQTIRRHVLTGAVSPRRAEEAMADFRDLRATRYPFLALLDRVWELRANLSAFDAAYVALAEALGAPLVTCDRRLAQAPGHRAEIQLLP